MGKTLPPQFFIPANTLEMMMTRCQKSLLIKDLLLVALVSIAIFLHIFQVSFYC